LTLAFVSHDLSVIRRLCGTTLVLYQGEIVEHAATPEVFARPKAQYTRDLLDAIPLPEVEAAWLGMRAGQGA
ncbi:ABC transporter ATP-binding protein, partial [Rhodobacteraceae bacterium R_SAG7]|nr:ABC transporter ATP-binding protein [Rhodobacteraceae bacterium R_SAG7]